MPEVAFVSYLVNQSQPCFSTWAGLFLKAYNACVSRSRLAGSQYFACPRGSLISRDCWWRRPGTGWFEITHSNRFVTGPFSYTLMWINSRSISSPITMPPMACPHPTDKSKHSIRQSLFNRSASTAPASPPNPCKTQVVLDFGRCCVYCFPWIGYAALIYIYIIFPLRSGIKATQLH